MMTKDGLIFEANSLKQGRLQALTRQQLQAQATQNRERRWVAPSVPPRQFDTPPQRLRVLDRHFDVLVGVSGPAHPPNPIPGVDTCQAKSSSD